MNTFISTVATLGVALVLAAPAPVLAQRRAPSDDGGSEPARTASSRSSDSEPAPRAEPAPRSEPAPRAEPASRSEGPAPRAVAARSEGQSKARPAASAAAGASRTATATRRVATERPVIGTAAPRRFADERPVRIIYSPVYFPTAYGYGYGPWGYRGSYAGHGYWYSPFGYSYRPGYGYGYGYSGYYGYRHRYGYPIYYGYPVYYGAAGGNSEDEQGASDPVQPSGSIRFRVSPASARIYIDGALAGTVDDFNGLSEHLQLSPGSHVYELQAEGYRPHSGVLTVVVGQTRTERVNLRKQ